MSTDEPFVYDKAKYHSDSVQEEGLPEEHAYHHTTFFLSWLLKKHFMSDWFESEGKDEIAKYRAGKISVNQLYEWWDTCLVSDMLSNEGNAFAMHYFEFEKGAYLAEYAKHLQGSLPTEFHVPYNPENEVIAHKMISEQYEKWSKSRK